MATRVATARTAAVGRTAARTSRAAVSVSAEAAERGGSSRGTSRREDRAPKSILGVPSRFMKPRIVLIACVVILVGFGLLMVFSASSVTALGANGDAAYYLKRQLGFVAVGAVMACILAKMDYHWWVGKMLPVVWVVTLALLVLVLAIGTDNDMGATRWIDLGFFDLQPSEFAKLTIVFTAANLAGRYFEDGSLALRRFAVLLVLGVVLPVCLILVQPDKGTTMVVALTLIVMGYLAGIPWRYLAILLVVGALAFLAISLRDEYSRARFFAMFDPWSTENRYGDAWQLCQGFYAFGTGGLIGVGIGFSRQKYSYLPMAHNDFIFAVIGEECGLAGTLGVLAGFMVFLWAGLEIARQAPDLPGRLVAAGCTSLIIIQLFLNVAGVLGLFPMSGKPIPFLSYGGSSIIASLMLVGLIISVSVHSRLPETRHDSARRSMREVEDAPVAGRDLTLVGEPRVRSRGGFRERGERDERATRERAEQRASRPDFRVVEGGGGPRERGGTDAARTRSSGGRQRIDLGPSAAERLRGSGQDERRRGR